MANSTTGDCRALPILNLAEVMAVFCDNDEVRSRISTDLLRLSLVFVQQTHLNWASHQISSSSSRRVLRKAVSSAGPLILCSEGDSVVLVLVRFEQASRSIWEGCVSVTKWEGVSKKINSMRHTKLFECDSAGGGAEWWLVMSNEDQVVCLPWPWNYSVHNSPSYIYLSQLLNSQRRFESEIKKIICLLRTIGIMSLA